MLYIKSIATELIDNSSYPAIVLLNFCDINGIKHEFIEKWPIISDEEFTNMFPIDCAIGCTLLKEEDNSYIVSTSSPWGIESEDGLTTFEIDKNLLIKK